MTHHGFNIGAEFRAIAFTVVFLFLVGFGIVSTVRRAVTAAKSSARKKERLKIKARQRRVRLETLTQTKVGIIERRINLIKHTLSAKTVATSRRIIEDTLLAIRSSGVFSRTDQEKFEGDLRISLAETINERVDFLSGYYADALVSKAKGRREVADNLAVLELLVSDLVLNGEVARLAVGKAKARIGETP